MLIGYVRISKADGSQSPDLQYDALRAAGVEPGMIYEDRTSGARGDRPGLENCLRALRGGDVLVVWKLDRLGRNLAHLVSIVKALSESGVGLKVLTGQGAQIDTTTAPGRLVFGIFAALAEFERELIRERTIAGLSAARARVSGHSATCSFSVDPGIPFPDNSGAHALHAVNTESRKREIDRQEPAFRQRSHILPGEPLALAG